MVPIIILRCVIIQMFYPLQLILVCESLILRFNKETQPSVIIKPAGRTNVHIPTSVNVSIKNTRGLCFSDWNCDHYLDTINSTKTYTYLAQAWISAASRETPLRHLDLENYVFIVSTAL